MMCATSVAEDEMAPIAVTTAAGAVLGVEDLCPLGSQSSTIPSRWE